MTKTKPIKEFTNPIVRKLMDECEEALRPIAEKYGLTLDQKGRTYRRDALPVMFQLLVTEKDEDGNALSAMAKDFQNMAPLFGLEPDDLGKEFTRAGKTFRITGLKPRSRKYPVLAENVKTGKTYKFPAETVKEALKRAA